jgi:hypothetical protein
MTSFPSTSLNANGELPFAYCAIIVAASFLPSLGFDNLSGNGELSRGNRTLDMRGRDLTGCKNDDQERPGTPISMTCEGNDSDSYWSGSIAFSTSRLNVSNSSGFTVTKRSS